MQHTIEFDGIQPVIDGIPLVGMVLDGKAVLASSHEEEPHEFYVQSIEITSDIGGRKFVLDHSSQRSVARNDQFRAVLFTAIAEQIESDRTSIGRYAQAEFSSAVDDGAYEERCTPSRTDVPMFKPRPGFDAKTGVPA